MLLRDKARLFTDSVVKQFKLFDCESSIILDQSCFVGPYLDASSNRNTYQIGVY